MTTTRAPWTGRRELAPAVALALLLVIVALLAPSFFSAANLGDLALNNASVLLVAAGMTVVIVLGEIDISIGSQFALCSVLAGLLAKAHLPMLLLAPCIMAIGAMLGLLNGVLIGALGLPSIVVTLAMLVVWRDLLRWLTDGAWIDQLPATFQWFGIGSAPARWLIVGGALLVVGVLGASLRHLRVGRAPYAVGADADAARLAGLEPARVVMAVFALMGALVGLAATLNAVRFDAVPGNAGVGLEMKAIAAVVVGGTAITGGRGTLLGTVLGVCLLGVIGTALSFVGISPFWEKAVQGAVILAALVSESMLKALTRPVAQGGRAPAAVR